jgi:hypothetical protein
VVGIGKVKGPFTISSLHLCKLKHIDLSTIETIHNGYPSRAVSHENRLVELYITCFQIEVQVARVVRYVLYSVVWRYAVLRQEVKGGKTLLAVENYRGRADSLPIDRAIFLSRVDYRFATQVGFPWGILSSEA